MIVAVRISDNKVINDIQSTSDKNITAFKQNIIDCYGGTESDYNFVSVKDIDVLKFFGSETPEGYVIDYNNIVYDSNSETFNFVYIEVV